MCNYQGSGKLAKSDKEAGGGERWLPAHQFTAKATVPMAGLRTPRPTGGNSHHEQRTCANIVKVESSMAGSTAVRDKWIVPTEATAQKRELRI